MPLVSHRSHGILTLTPLPNVQTCSLRDTPTQPRLPPLLDLFKLVYYICQQARVSIRLKYFLVLILFQYVYFLSYFQSGPIVLTVNVVEGRNLQPMDANGTGVNAV